MSSDTPVPPPPQGYASWLDYATEGPLRFAAQARAELAALRKELSDTQRNLQELNSQHAEVVKERDEIKERMRFALVDRQDAENTASSFLCQRNEARAELAKTKQERDAARAEIASKDNLLPSLLAEGAQIERERAIAAERERDALRAQVAEMRDAVLSLGFLTHNPKAHPSTDDGYDYPTQVVLSASRKEAWNSFFAKVRAEATQ